MHPTLSTSLIKILGCDYPIIQTAMGWVATSQLVCASIQAGAFGFLAAAVMDPAECEREIKKIKSVTDKPFGVNIHGFQPGVERIVDLCIEYKVAALSYGRGPNSKLIDKVKDAGLKCVPTIGNSKHACKAVKMGADILVCQGQEGGGHTGAIPTWLLLAEVLDLNPGVPVVACGGFKDGRGLAAALTFGAEGIAMGTRFMMSSDSPTPSATKAEYIKSQVSNIPVSSKLDGLPQRMLMNRTLVELEKSSSFGMLIRALRNGWKYKSKTGMPIVQILKTAWEMASKTDMTLGQTLMAVNAPMIIQKAMVEGKPDEGVLPSGQIAGLIYDLPNCAQMVSKIIEEAQINLMRVTSTVT
ncbi:NAD(P)H-dependent flavin oxidoreductase [Microbulbifer spongiae]|uniref:Nitronate monooxygenase n=1 Tax=Microbulbifer spongiae TaxID=2944933 RepID=A0ABY9E9D7_9GAMM|nr:nitronate monooxygenase [Microbulbifer sp. MI-G]WKD49060.1 nitronate monooxygenase [Microbulbifer sp. MI-G]